MVNNLRNPHNILASLYYVQGRYSEAEPLYKHALAIFEKVLGPDHPNVAHCLNNLAVLYYAQSRYSEAQPLYKRALAIFDEALGPEHPDVAGSLNNLASLYRDQGRYSEAEPLYERSLAIWEKALGPDHPDVALSLESFSDFSRQQGEHTKALELARRACSIRHKNFVENSIGLSEKDALTYSQFLRASLGKYLSCYLDLGSPNPATALEAADLVLACKGQVSDGILERQKSIVEGADSTTLSLGESLRYARFQLAKLFVEGPGEDVSAYRAEVDSLDRFSKQLEADLSRRSASFRGYVAYRDVNADRITSLLPRNSVLAEYVRYAYHDLELKKDTPHYLVVVMATDGLPRVVDLGESAEIDSVIGTYRSQMLRVATSGKAPTVVDEQEYRECVQDVYGRTWQPIEEYVSGRDLVFIAPDGALNMISFAALIDKNGNYLIEEYPIHYLSAGRDLVRLSDEPPPVSGLLALGAPDYNASASSRLQQPASQETTVTELAYMTTRNVRSGCGRLSDLSVPPLPGTRKEVELISSEWKKASHEPASIYFGSDASEERFKKEAHGTRVIHLATHGYFLEGACRPEVPEGSVEAGSGLGSDAGYVGENPLLLSGLFFAGANLHGEGADSLGCEDGILTAYEVSGMNLEGTELVVLSACETGLGRVEEGEGVYGLRRAFQMAGARTVVSALWPVSDEATAEMMSGFYERRSESIPETIRRIQLEKIRDLRRHGKVDHPFTWAGFIALGDWR
ncbi:MAG: CHAT domain-containing tetratricopeptide repeat protein [Candidatus Eisenbacteria bacterium]